MRYLRAKLEPFYRILYSDYYNIALIVKLKSRILSAWYSKFTVLGCWSWTGRPVLHFLTYCLVESPSTKNWPPFRAIAITVDTEAMLFVFFLRIVRFLATGEGSLRSAIKYLHTVDIFKTKTFTWLLFAQQKEKRKSGECWNSINIFMLGNKTDKKIIKQLTVSIKCEKSEIKHFRDFHF